MVTCGRAVNARTASATRAPFAATCNTAPCATWSVRITRSPSLRSVSVARNALMVRLLHYDVQHPSQNIYSKYVLISLVEAVCAVFGDPHYRTFDGLIYNFQGLCNYVLAEDCHRNYSTFSIRVRNEARLSQDFSWTKSVTVLLAGNRINLLQDYRVKVNRSGTRIY